MGAMETYRPTIRSLFTLRQPATPAPPLTLPRGTVRTVALPSGSVLHCLKGEGWLTGAGDPRDYRLRAGDTLLLSGPGPWVVQALTDSFVELRVEPVSGRRG